MEFTNATHSNDIASFRMTLYSLYCARVVMLCRIIVIVNGTTNTAHNNCRPSVNDNVDEVHEMLRDRT